MRTKTYIQFVCISALLAGALIWRLVPLSTPDAVTTLWTLAALALTAELLAYLMPRDAKASIAFIPYIATVLLVPNGSGLIAIVGAAALAQLSRQRSALKFFFNFAQIGLTYSAALLAYHYLGGVSLFDLTGLTVSAATQRVGLPMTVAYLVVF